jgi:L-threonylcarbamoyladenylate synthase
MITTNIDEAVDSLKKGQLIGLPTETVYGIAANAFDETAVKRIFEIKRRPMNNPLILHISSIDRIGEIAQDVPQKALDLANKFWPGSLTLLLKKRESVPTIVTAGHSTVAIRIPNHPLALDLLEKIDFPLAAPSANPFRRVSSTTAIQVEKYFGEELPVVLDGGKCSVGIESTIVGFYDDEVVIHRLGGISIEQIEKVVGNVKTKVSNEIDPVAPGMLKKHYSPLTKFVLTENITDTIEEFKGQKIGLLLFQGHLTEYPVFMQEVLSESADLNEASQNLYNKMIRLDEFDLDVIIAEKLPEIGLGKSLNDKLNRAAS